MQSKTSNKTAENVKTEVRTVKGPKASLARFKRPSDGRQIFVFAREGETRDHAILRVMKANGAEGGSYDYCN
jgi:hypothetical protein